MRKGYRVVRDLGNNVYHVHSDEEEYAVQVRALLFEYDLLRDMERTVKQFVQQRRGWKAQEAKLVAVMGGKARGKNTAQPRWMQELFAETFEKFKVGRKRLGRELLVKFAQGMAAERAVEKPVWRQRLRAITLHHAERWLATQRNKNDRLAVQPVVPELQSP